MPDAITAGTSGDYDAAPDLDVLADGITESMDELLRQARAMH